MSKDDQAKLKLLLHILWCPTRFPSCFIGVTHNPRNEENQQYTIDSPVNWTLCPEGQKLYRRIPGVE